MKTKLTAPAKVIWQTLTEVPGWPDAPVRVRVTRVMPIALPVAAVIGIFLWRVAVLGPRVERDRVALQPLEQLESEIAALRVTASDQQVAQLAQEAKTASTQLVENADALPELFHTYRTIAAKHDWDATFQMASPTEEASADNTPSHFWSVRAKLKPTPENHDVLGSLIAALDGLSGAGKRFDLTSLAIRADDSHWQAVEVHLRLACSAAHAKTP